MKCEICQRDETLKGHALCPVCGEAVMRLVRVAGHAQEQLCSQPKPVVCERKNFTPEEFKAAFAGGRGK